MLKVSIPKQELDELHSELKKLREFYNFHKTSVNLNKVGRGTSEYSCKCKHVPQKKDDPQKIVTCHEELPVSIITSQLWKRYQKRGSKLLESLQKSGRFNWDRFGVAFIDGNKSGSVFDLMKATFQTSTEDIRNYDMYINLLNSLGLVGFVTNKSLLLNDCEGIATSRFWYYIGEL